MGVRTAADEQIIEAKQKLSEAYKALLTVLDENTWGHSAFDQEYIDTVMEAANDIIKWKRKL